MFVDHGTLAIAGPSISPSHPEDSVPKRTLKPCQPSVRVSHEVVGFVNQCSVKEYCRQQPGEQGYANQARRGKENQRRGAHGHDYEQKVNHRRKYGDGHAFGKDSDQPKLKSSRFHFDAIELFFGQFKIGLCVVAFAAHTFAIQRSPALATSCKAVVSYDARFFCGAAVLEIELHHVLFLRNSSGGDSDRLLASRARYLRSGFVIRSAKLLSATRAFLRGGVVGDVRTLKDDGHVQLFATATNRAVAFSTG